MSEAKHVCFVCHMYDRSEAQPHIGSFLGDTVEQAMSAVQAALIAHKVQFSDEQLADALDAWRCGERHFEFDEDGVSLAFLRLVDGEFA
jgi:hypothetical protein